MYSVDMHYTIKTLLAQGKSHRSIAEALGISRGTVKRTAERLAALKGEVKQPALIRSFKVDAYAALVKGWVEDQGLGARHIWQLLKERGVTDVSESAVRRYLERFHHSSGEVYIPLLAAPGEEAQVDFGYFGYFEKDGKRVKVWVFCMVLSHSRYAYYREVTDQSIPTFLRCHMEAWQYFGGVPLTTKIDNPKAGVLQADFYEPTIQHQYAQMLAHYGSAPITARVRRGQDKGKVEAGIKYVKNSFLNVLPHRDYQRMSGDLARWNSSTCNKRVHGTTRKVPADVFIQAEKPALLPMPPTRYEITDIAHRKVGSLGHIYFGYNYYSVPHTLTGQSLRTESNGRILRIFNEQESISAGPVAVHSIASGKGQFVTLDAHKPPGKRAKSDEVYLVLIGDAGEAALALTEAMRIQRPHHWKGMARGILQLVHRYDRETVNAACARALAYKAYAYLSVKRICEQGLFTQGDEPADADAQPVTGGHGHDLSIYDRL